MSANVSTCSFAHVTKPAYQPTPDIEVGGGAELDLPDAMRFSLNAVIYQSLVCRMMVKHTMASSLI
jgi:hypothetical protein